MLYFDLAPALKLLSDENRGKLLTAILEYAQYGTVPDFECDSLAIAWSFIQPKIDHEAKRYEDTVHKKTYASYCAKLKQANQVPLYYDDWCTMVATDHVDPADTTRTPTTAATTSSFTDLSITPSISSGTTNTGLEALRRAQIQRLLDYKLD